MKRLSKYDYLVVGAGLFGSVFANEAVARGKRVLVIDKRNHTGGNCACVNINGINVHRYGAHIFHTSDKRIWDYVNNLAEFNNFVNTPYAFFRGKLYSMPFNMNTFNALWGVTTPSAAKEMISRQTARYQGTEPKNLEEKALCMVGDDIYNTLIKGYTEKQWGRPATELPPFIISRLPLRYTFDNNYFFDRYQGIPIGGYNVIFDRLLENVEVRLQTEYFSERAAFEKIADKIIFTGPIDAYYDYCEGALEYRSLRFEDEILPLTDDYQGNAVINYTDSQPAFTRIIEHKHFERTPCAGTVVTREYPAPWEPGREPYYTINDEKNGNLYKAYRYLADNDDKVIFGGRLGDYKYYDMHHVIAAALALSRKIL